MRTARRRLLAWYDKNRRPLPWRRTKDPYRILVSEIMLQQTRVEVVVAYYEGFLARFPSLEALAAADLDEVLARWSGLGYYGRARRLHQAAQEIVSRHGGFPQTAPELRRLPGIGAYTSAAVASIAFGEQVLVLDGNAERVLSRLLALDSDPRRKEGRDQVRRAGEALLDPRRPGDSNQALMELGATLCTPRRPGCPHCPLVRDCRATAAGVPESFPPRRRKPKPTRVRWLVAVAHQDGRILLVRRPGGSGLLAGLWELPWVELGGEGPSPEERLRRRYGGRWELGGASCTVRHGMTTRALELEVRKARYVAGGSVAEGLEAGWFSEEERRHLGLPATVGKALEAAAELEG